MDIPGFCHLVRDKKIKRLSGVKGEKKTNCSDRKSIGKSPFFPLTNNLENGGSRIFPPPWPGVHRFVNSMLVLMRFPLMVRVVMHMGFQFNWLVLMNMPL